MTVANNQGSPISALRKTLNAALDEYEKGLASLEIPNNVLDATNLGPHNPFQPIPPPIQMEKQKALSALDMLRSSLLSPMELIVESFGEAAILAHMKVIVHSKPQIADTIMSQKDQEKGTSVKELAQATKIDAEKLERLLRLMAARHWFVERSPGFFAPTRLTSVLVSTSPIAAWLRSHLKHTHRALHHLPDLILDPATTSSTIATETAFNKDFTKESWFQYLQSSGDFADFGLAMKGVFAIGIKATAEDYDWERLVKENKVLVDIGGGQGEALLPILQRHEKLQAVLQDRPEVIELARKNFQKHLPEALESKRLTLESHDFFTPNPRKGKQYVFFMRAILHDWSEEECVKILTAFKESLDSKGENWLIVHEKAIQPGFTSKQSSTTSSDSNSWPLPTNYSSGNFTPLVADQVMLTFANGAERTQKQFDDLFSRVGLKRGYTLTTQAGNDMMEVRPVAS